MNDDVKKALEWIREMLGADRRPVARNLLAHLEAEPARLAAACEEQREALGLNRWPTLIPFLAAMVRKLDANKDKKGGREGWQDDDPGDLMKRVLEEAGELEHAVDTKGARAILAEAADVANMAMMVADASGALDAAPLTPTPLADENKALRAERDALRAAFVLVADAGGNMDPATAHIAVHRLRGDHDRLKAERDAALVRVKELEARAKGLETSTHAVIDQRDALKAQLAEAHERLDEFGARRDGQTATLVEGIDAMRGRLLEYRRWVNEAEEREAKLKAQLAEAMEGVELLRAIRRRAKTPQPGRWVDNVFHPQLSEDEVRAKAAEIAAADAFLAKVKP